MINNYLHAMNDASSTFDEDILSEFLSKEDKECFIKWADLLLSQDYSMPGDTQTVIATFYRYRWPEYGYGDKGKRSLLLERITIPLDEYESRFKQKLRAHQIDSILVHHNN